MSNEYAETDETIETPAINDDEIASFIDGGKEPTFHPILMVWREVLKPAVGEKDSAVTPAWANKICATYQGIRFADMNGFRDTYFAKILTLAALLDAEIATDDECLLQTTPEEDVVDNGDHYRALLTTWQLEILSWEINWDCTSWNAEIEVAAISEVHKMFFGQTGLTSFLDNIQFQFTEADQAELIVALEALKAGS